MSQELTDNPPGIWGLGELVGRDSHLDTKPSILENRPTEMIQFARGLGSIGLNMPTTSNLSYDNLYCHRKTELDKIRRESLPNEIHYAH